VPVATPAAAAEEPAAVPVALPAAAVSVAAKEVIGADRTQTSRADILTNFMLFPYWLLQWCIPQMAKSCRAEK
jgi:hypothetical protein